MDHHVAKETILGATLGPFTHNPLDSKLIVSPLQTVDKKGSCNRRVVMDLSYPEGQSVNEGIPKDQYQGELVQLKYPSIDNLVDLVRQKGVGCKLF